MKSEVIAVQVAAIQAADAQALEAGLGAAYDQGVLDQKSDGGGLSQADIDAAVKAAVDPLNLQIASDAQALSDAQAKAASDLAVVQQALVDMTAKEKLEETAVSGLQSAVTQVQASLDAIKAIVLPIFGQPLV